MKSDWVNKIRLRMIESKDYLISMKTMSHNIMLSVDSPKDTLKFEIYDNQTGLPSNILNLNNRDLDYLIRFIESAKESTHKIDEK
jgi:hypothetical protein